MGCGECWVYNCPDGGEGHASDLMQTPHTYRAQAEICLRQAEYAKTPRHRLSLLQMAQTWLRMADEADVVNKRLYLDKAS